MTKVRNCLIVGLGALGLLFSSALTTTLTAGQSAPVAAAHAPQATVYDL
jgi:hypothetical protein